MLVSTLTTVPQRHHVCMYSHRYHYPAQAKKKKEKKTHHKRQSQIGQLLPPRRNKICQIHPVWVVVGLPGHLHKQTAGLQAEERGQLLAVFVPPHNVPARVFMRKNTEKEKSIMEITDQSDQERHSTTATTVLAGASETRACTTS